MEMPASVTTLLKTAIGRQSCLLCYQSSDELLCPWCQQDLCLFNLQACSYNLLLWPKIRQGLGEIRYQRLLACGEYQWPLDRLIKGLKFSRNPAMPGPWLIYFMNMYSLITAPGHRLLFLCLYTRHGTEPGIIIRQWKWPNACISAAACRWRRPVNATRPRRRKPNSPALSADVTSGKPLY